MSVAQLADAEVMLGRDRQRLAKTERKGFVEPGSAARPSHLLAARITGLPDAAHQFGEDLVGGDDARPRIDQENDEVGLLDGGHGLLAHAGGETRIAVLEPRGIDQP